MSETLRAFASLAFDLFGELVAPSRCVACDERVRMNVLFCAACLVSVERAPPPRWDDAHAVFDYGGAVASAILRFKYGGRSDLAPRLAAVMGEVAADLVLGVDAVVPVPLHPKRIVERGFDQTALLAQPIARRLGVPCRVTALERLRDTPKQASLDRAARAENVRAAFQVSKRARERLSAGGHVLLVDDVATTGATMAACVAALRKGGVNRVTTLVLARKGLDP